MLTSGLSFLSLFQSTFIVQHLSSHTHNSIMKLTLVRCRDGIWRDSIICPKHSVTTQYTSNLLGAAASRSCVQALKARGSLLHLLTILDFANSIGLVSSQGNQRTRHIQPNLPYGHDVIGRADCNQVLMPIITSSYNCRESAARKKVTSSSCKPKDNCRLFATCKVTCSY